MYFVCLENQVQGLILSDIMLVQWRFDQLRMNILIQLKMSKMNLMIALMNVSYHLVKKIKNANKKAS